MIYLSERDTQHLFRIIDSIYHSADVDTPLHQLLGADDLNLLRKINEQIKPDGSAWPKQPLRFIEP